MDYRRGESADFFKVSCDVYRICNCVLQFVSVCMNALHANVQAYNV